MDMYKYRQRLMAESSMENLENSTKMIVNRTFHESPSFQKVSLNGLELDARVNINDEKEAKKTILFRPDTKFFKGDVVEFNSTHWLVVDIYDNDIYPTAYVELCNDWLRWKNDTGIVLAYPCVVKGQKISLDEGKYENRYVVLSENVVTIKVQNNLDTKAILPRQRFLLHDIPYEIKGIDLITNVLNGKGYIELEAEQSLSEISDDTENDVADNEDSNWGDWS